MSYSVHNLTQPLILWICINWLGRLWVSAPGCKHKYKHSIKCKETPRYAVSSLRILCIESDAGESLMIPKCILLTSREAAVVWCSCLSHASEPVPYLNELKWHSNKSHTWSIWHAQFNAERIKDINSNLFCILFILQPFKKTQFSSACFRK